MTAKPKDSRRTIRVFAIALASCMALIAASASSAFALSWQGGEYPTEFVASGSAFHGASYTNSVTCKSETVGAGNLVDETSGTVTLTFKGCVAPVGGSWVNCQSSGQPKETVVTEPLSMSLAELPGEEAGVVLDPNDSENVFAEFACWGLPVKWTGAVIGELTDPDIGGGPSTTLSIDFDASGSEQEFTQTYHGWNAQLEQSWNNWESHDLGLSGSLELDLGEEVTLSPEGPDHPHVTSSAGLPTTVSMYSEAKVTLRPTGSGRVVNCTGSESSPAVSAIGEFGSFAGEAELTFRDCKESTLNASCTTAGEPTGTVKTKVLPVRLTYLDDGSPGIAFEANESSGKFAEMSCVGGFVKLVVTGGVLGSITNQFGVQAFNLNADVNAVSEGEGYAQEYTETESGEGLGLLASSNHGEPQAEVMDMQGGFGFGWSLNEEEEIEGEVQSIELRE